jgi:hypothetical protein
MAGKKYPQPKATLAMITIRCEKQFPNVFVIKSTSRCDGPSVPLSRRAERRLGIVEGVGPLAIRPGALLRPLWRGKLARVGQCLLTVTNSGL